MTREETKKELEENGFALSDLKKYDGFTWDEVWLKDNLAVCLDWYENGELERKFNYKNGKYHGVFECWF